MQKTNYGVTRGPPRHSSTYFTFFVFLVGAFNKQAGNGPSRRHIQGSKIAKGLQSIKYSLLKYPHEEKIEKNRFSKFFWSGKSHSAEKCKRGPQKSLINLYLKCQ